MPGKPWWLRSLVTVAQREIQSAQMEPEAGGTFKAHT